MFHLSLSLDLKHVIVFVIGYRSTVMCSFLCSSVSVADQDRGMPLKSSHPPYPPYPRGTWYNLPDKPPKPHRPPSELICRFVVSEVVWITPETTSIPDDTDQPDNTPAGATAAPTPDDTRGCYINTQRDAEK